MRAARRRRSIQHDLLRRDARRFIDWTSCCPGDRLDDLGYMAWTWCIQAEGNVPVDVQAAHLRELRDAYGPVLPEDLIEAMIRAQDRILLHPERAIRDARYPAARRAWAEEAVRWASADQELIRASEQVLLAALRQGDAESPGGKGSLYTPVRPLRSFDNCCTMAL
jgi:aminoglycoside phosphotransferase (APT) family kinase protein